MLFVIVAFALRDVIEDELLEGNEFLFYALVASVLAFGASFLARGFLAGERRFGLFSLLLIIDSSARLAFSLAVAVGIAEGVDPIAIGVVAGPALSLLVVPFAAPPAAAARGGADPGSDEGTGRAWTPPTFTLAHGAGFAAAVLLIMLSEQIFLSSGALFARAEEGAAAAGFMFNILMVARAPVVLFQAVAASLLPAPHPLAIEGRRVERRRLPAVRAPDDPRYRRPSVLLALDRCS